MIDFKENYTICTSKFNPELQQIDLGLSGLKIINLPFHSDFKDDYPNNHVVSGDLFYHELVRSQFVENNDFTYPVILPETGRKFDKGILFFHGLNERSWDKYMVWAQYLAEKTECPVIMFPIAYHINRAPKRWSDPRSMAEVAASRKKDGRSTTFVNAALSIRMESHPEKFVISGLQSYFDIKKLATEIKLGNHCLFNANAHLDIFSYSIGAFLSEVLLLNNPDGMFTTSKLFMFCGGATFDSMNGISKFIMDEKAFESLQQLSQPKNMKQLRRSLFSQNINNLKNAWDGLYMMMNTGNQRKRREKLLKARGHNILAVALEKDKVIPPQKIVDTLKGKKGNLPVRVEIIDFPYDYTHEIPFPVTNNELQPMVSRCFSAVFDKAVDFFTCNHES